MNINNHFSLNKLQSDAQDKLSKLTEWIGTVHDGLKRRMGGRSRGSMIGGIIMNAVWLVIYVILYAVCREAAFHPLISLLSVAASVLLILFMVIGGFVEMGFYGTVLRSESRLIKLKNRVESAKRNLHGDMKTYNDRMAMAWEQPLQPGEPLEEELRQIETQLTGVQNVESGFVHGMKNAMYYVTTVAWTIMGSGLIYNLIYPLVEGDVSEKTANIVSWILILLGCVGAVLVAKLLWGKTDCRVKNLTLLGTLSGPVVFALLAVVAILLVLAVKLILAAIGFIIAAVIAFSCCCGG